MKRKIGYIVAVAMLFGLLFAVGPVTTQAAGAEGTPILAASSGGAMQVLVAAKICPPKYKWNKKKGCCWSASKKKCRCKDGKVWNQGRFKCVKK